MTIKEENIQKKINTLYSENNNWLTTYREIKKEVKEAVKASKYASIDSNYNSLFFYEMIKQKSSLEDFKIVLNEFLNKTKSDTISHTLSRFFHTRDADITMVHYFTKDRFNNNYSNWTNMLYLFLDLKENKEETELNKKYTIILNSENLDYLALILNSFNKDNVKELWFGSFHSFLYNFTNNILEFEPLYKLIQNNAALSISEAREYSSLNECIINDISNSSYENTRTKNIDSFQSLQKMIPNFDKKLPNLLFKTNTKINTNTATDKILDINLGFFNFLRDVGVDTLSIIQNKYNTEFKKLKKELDNSLIINKPHSSDEHINSYYENQPFNDLFGNIRSTIDVGLDSKSKAKPFVFSLKNLNVQNNWLQNLPSIHYLYYAIKFNPSININITDKQINYILKEKETYLSLKSDSLLYINTPNDFFDLVTPFIEYNKLQKSLVQTNSPVTTTNAKKMKV